MTFECAASAAAKVEGVDTHRLRWVGPLTVAASVGANAIVRDFALDLFGIPPMFHHLIVGHLTSLTIVAVGTAIIVFAVVVSHAGRPIRLWRRRRPSTASPRKPCTTPSSTPERAERS